LAVGTSGASAWKIGMTGPQILIAEDDVSWRDLIAQALGAKGVKSLQAGDGVQALKLLEANSGILVLLTDVRMPSMGGYLLAEKALELRPELKVLMMTAFAGADIPPKVLQAREFRLLIKPVSPKKICDLVIDMLERP
jgi:DNA-binding NtrC family response regulator